MKQFEKRGSFIGCQLDCAVNCWGLRRIHPRARDAGDAINIKAYDRRSQADMGRGR